MWKDGVGDVRLRQPMALSVDMGSEGGGGPSSGDEEKPIRAVQPRRNFPTIYALAVLGAFTLLFSIVFVLDQWLPSPLSLEDAENNPDKFNAHRAYRRLEELARFGIKTAGSVISDRDVRLWVENELQTISAGAHESKRVEIDSQYITGSFHMAFANRYTSSYDNIVNVVARLSDKRNNNTEALLVNCHFDSVPGSPGVNDDNIFCVFMLETLQILSSQSTPLTHNIIFLFNGAEENAMQASHGFIKFHKWRTSVKAYVNLDSCGAGSREILFQTAVHDPWLLEAYAESVPRPHGFVVGEEIFQSGIIPSDTDFRIFRDFGNLPGLDFAYYRNGYVYHTGFDDLNQTSKEAMQHTGDNVLALIAALANSPYLNGPHEHSGNRTVFFDLFGFTMVHYSQTTGAVVGLSIILLSVYTTVSTLLHLGPGMRRKELCIQGLKALVGPSIGWLMALGWCCLLALFLDFISNSMTWFAQPLILLPLYAVPTFLFASLGLYLQYVLTRLSPLCGEVRVQLYSLGVQLIWTTLLLALTLLQSRSAYLLQFMVFFPSLASFLVLWFARPGGKIGTWLWLQLGALIVPTSIAFYHVLSLIFMLVPVMGRMGPHVNTELLIAVTTSVCTLMCVSYLAPMVPLVRNPKRIFEFLALVHAIGLAVALSPLAFPYSGHESASPAPQRVNILQVHRQFFTNDQKLYHNDSGLWFLNMDRNSPRALLNEVPALVKAKVLSADCHKNLTCGLPIYSSRWLPMCPGSLWLPTRGFPTVSPNTRLVLKQNRKVAVDRYGLDFELTGPSHLGMILCPFHNISLLHWSLDAEILSTGFLEDRPYYFVYIGREYRRVSEPWKLSITLKVPPNHSDDLIQVIAMGHYFSDVPYGPLLNDILDKKPTWSHATIWSSSYNSHIFSV